MACAQAASGRELPSAKAAVSVEFDRAGALALMLCVGNLTPIEIRVLGPGETWRHTQSWFRN